MDRRRLRRVLILAAAAVLCLVMVRISYRGQRGGAGSLTLWYAESDCPGAVMDALVSLCHTETGLLIETQSFEDEKALGSAFESARPDLVFCSHVRAGGFESRASLGDAGASIPLPEALREVWEEIGRSFFPVGGRLPVLLVNTALVSGEFDSLEALLDAAGDEPFLASDDLSDFLYALMNATGHPMTGDMDTDRTDSAFLSLYNRLAEAAFRGALVPTEEAVDYVRQGLVPCAVVRSTELAGLTDGDLSLRPLPLPEGAEPQYTTELLGFALPEGANTEAAGSFLRWLFTGARSGETALAAGLVPVTVAASARTPIETALLELPQNGVLYCPPPDSVFYANRGDCEERLTQALEQLS